MRSTTERGSRAALNLDRRALEGAPRQGGNSAMCGAIAPHRCQGLIAVKIA